MTDRDKRTLAGALLHLVWDIQDAGGHSWGRSRENRMLEAAIGLVCDDETLRLARQTDPERLVERAEEVLNGERARRIAEKESRMIREDEERRWESQRKDKRPER